MWGSWSACTVTQGPSEEECNGRDDDCDGRIDEGGVCGELVLKSVQVIEDGCTRPNDELQVKVTVDNLGDRRIEDLKITITSDDFDFRFASGTFNLGGHDTETLMVRVVVPNASPGFYPLRVTVSNGAVHKVAYRDLAISPWGC
jgi:hypothetical protein